FATVALELCTVAGRLDHSHRWIGLLKTHVVTEGRTRAKGTNRVDLTGRIGALQLKSDTARELHIDAAVIGVAVGRVDGVAGTHLVALNAFAGACLREFWVLGVVLLAIGDQRVTDGFKGRPDIAILMPLSAGHRGEADDVTVAVEPLEETPIAELV